MEIKFYSEILLLSFINKSLIKHVFHTYTSRMGVPQGFAFSPTLSLLFVNDMPQPQNNSVDITLRHPIDNTNSELNGIIDVLKMHQTL